jgi:probable addiction module antidote protein
MRKLRPYVSDEREQIRAFRANPKRAIGFLNAAIQIAFEEDEPELLLSALATAARAYGMTHIAKKADLKRESLHRMLSKRGNPEWNSMFRVFKALNLRPKLESAHRAAA